MYDYGLSVMQQYGLNVQHSYRGRGALICQTQEGLYLLRPFVGSVKRLERQCRLLTMLSEEYGMRVDVPLFNLEGSLVSTDEQETSYVLRRWYEGKECDTRDKEEVLRSVEALTQLHRAMKMPGLEQGTLEPLQQEYLRHNRELRKIRKFIRGKKVSSPFERQYLNSVEEFLEWAQEAVQCLQESSYEQLRQEVQKQGLICHGEFNQHHVLLQGNQISITGFDKWKYDLQVADLYCFMRKILEKADWDVRLGEKMLETYDRAKTLSKQEYEHLKIRFSYPEKYWKLANYYYAHNKAWISEKNVEKLQNVLRQKKAWREFIREIF